MKKGTKDYYAATRIRAKISRLLKSEDYAKLMKMDINEFLLYLEEREYKKEIDAVGAKASKIEMLEQVLNNNLANSINGMLRFMPKNSPLWPYIMKYEIANIKAVMRGIENKAQKQDVLQNLVPAGSFNKEFLQSLMEKGSTAQFIDALRPTPYYSALKENGGKKLEELEDCLEQFYYKGLLEIAASHKIFLGIVQVEIDIRNILTLFRLKKAKIANIKNFFISGGNFKLSQLSELYKLEESDIISRLRKYKFWKYVPQNTKEIDKIEAGLRKFLYMRGESMLKFRPTFEPMIGYILEKEREICNIRILARSKLSKNPEDALNIRSRLFVK